MMIEKILADIKAATELDVYSEKSTYKKNCIVYSLTKRYDNGAVAQWQLTIKILTDSISKAFEAQNIIDNLLVIKGDEQKYDEITQCVQDGGGTVWDDELNMYQRIVYYSFITKSNVDWRI